MAVRTINKTKSKPRRKLTANEVSDKPFDFVLLVTVLVLLGIGIVMVLSASSPSALAMTGSSFTFVSMQAIAAVIGIAAMLFVSRIDYKLYTRFYKIAYAVSIFGLLLVLVPGLRKDCRWSDTMDKLAVWNVFSTIRDYKNRIDSFLCSISFTT